MASEVRMRFRRPTESQSPEIEVGRHSVELWRLCWCSTKEASRRHQSWTRCYPSNGSSSDRVSRNTLHTRWTGRSPRGIHGTRDGISDHRCPALPSHRSLAASQWAIGPALIQGNDLDGVRGRIRASDFQHANVSLPLKW